MFERLDNLIEKIAENERVASRVKNFKPKHWFLLGFATYLMFNVIFGIVEIILSFFTGISLVMTSLFVLITEFILEAGGYEEVTRFTDVLSSASGIIVEPTPETIPVVTSWFMDIMKSLIGMFSEMGTGFYEIFSINFPMLLDIDLDLEWIHISVSYISRAVIAFLQFVLLFYIMRRLRRLIRNKVKKRIAFLDNDYFDKQYFSEVTCV